MVWLHWVALPKTIPVRFAPMPSPILLDAPVNWLSTMMYGFFIYKIKNQSFSSFFSAFWPLSAHLFGTKCSRLLNVLGIGMFFQQWGFLTNDRIGRWKFPSTTTIQCWHHQFLQWPRRMFGRINGPTSGKMWMRTRMGGRKMPKPNRLGGIHVEGCSPEIFPPSGTTVPRFTASTTFLTRIKWEWAIGIGTESIGAGGIHEVGNEQVKLFYKKGKKN